MGLEILSFSPIDSILSVLVEDIQEFKILDKSYTLNKFRSIKDVQSFLNENRKDLTFFKYWSDISDYGREMYIKNTKLHRLDGPAQLVYYADNVEKQYYIDGWFY